jgi:hypothetical protein
MKSVQSTKLWLSERRTFRVLFSRYYSDLLSWLDLPNGHTEAYLKKLLVSYWQIETQFKQLTLAALTSFEMMPTIASNS